MRRLTALVALMCALAACGGAGRAQPGFSLSVDTNPFRLTLLENGKRLVAEDKGARLRYQLRSTGDQFMLTKVISSRGGVYEVATNEPGRTATVTVTRRPSGYRVALRLHPETNVQQVYDAFETSKGDHFLGGGERGDGVDLRGRILPVRVSYTCSYAPVPYFASSAGWAVRLATQRFSALAFPGSPGGDGGCAGAQRQCAWTKIST
jgi:alpha-D-xyloside xylohydrolase